MLKTHRDSWDIDYQPQLVTLQGTNISPKNGILKMIFLSPRWDMLASWGVYSRISEPSTVCKHPRSGPKVRNLQWGPAMDAIHGWVRWPPWPWALLFSWPGYANHVGRTAPFLDVFLEPPNGAPCFDWSLNPCFWGGLQVDLQETEVMAGFERLLLSVLLNSHEASIYGGIFAPTWMVEF